MTFYGYKRPDGRVGVRNKVLILPASIPNKKPRNTKNVFRGE